MKNYSCCDLSNNFFYCWHAEGRNWHSYYSSLSVALYLPNLGCHNPLIEEHIVSIIAHYFIIVMMSRALSLLFPLLQVYIVIGTSCQFNYEVDCNNPYSANAWVTFVDPDYVASVTFHWGQENTDIGPQEYSSTSSQTYVGDFFNFGKVGEFNVGATVTFGEGSSCNGQVIRRNQTIWFEESACGLSGEGEETDAPSVSPVVDNIVTTPRPTPSEIELSTFRPTSSEVEVSVFRIVACISVIHRSFSHQRFLWHSP